MNSAEKYDRYFQHNAVKLRIVTIFDKVRSKVNNIIGIQNKEIYTYKKVKALLKTH